VKKALPSFFLRSCDNRITTQEGRARKQRGEEMRGAEPRNICAMVRGVIKIKQRARGKVASRGFTITRFQKHRGKWGRSVTHIPILEMSRLNDFLRLCVECPLSSFAFPFLNKKGNLSRSSIASTHSSFYFLASSLIDVMNDNGQPDISKVLLRKDRERRPNRLAYSAW